MTEYIKELLSGINLEKEELAALLYHMGNLYSNERDVPHDMHKAALFWEKADILGNRYAKRMHAFAREDNRPFGAPPHNSIACDIYDLDKLKDDQINNKAVIEEIYRELYYRLKKSEEDKKPRRKNETCMEDIRNILGEEKIKEIEKNVPEYYRYQRKDIYL